MNVKSIILWLLFCHCLCAETVILVHGLARSASSMRNMEAFLKEAGYDTLNVDYPSTRYPIETLVEEHILPQIREVLHTTERIYFVTHSMGGIIVRYLHKHGHIQCPLRVVMLSPPNHGSEVVDKLGGLFAFRWLNGPAGLQLGTDTHSVPNQLGKVEFDLGVITGSRSINLILSALIPGEDDGKVSVNSTKIEGMKDFIIMPASHTFIMNKKDVQQQVLYFLKNGNFTDDSTLL